MDELNLDVERPEQVATALRAAAGEYRAGEGTIKGWQWQLPWPRIAAVLESTAQKIEEIARLS